MNKKLLSVLLAGSALFCMTACGDAKKADEPADDIDPKDAQEEKVTTEYTPASLQGLNYEVGTEWPEDTSTFDQSITRSYDTGIGTVVVNAVPMDEAGAEFAHQVETATEEENADIGLRPVDIDGCTSAWEITPSSAEEDAKAQTLAVTIFSRNWIYTVSYTTDKADTDEAAKQWADLRDSLSVTAENEETPEDTAAATEIPELPADNTDAPLPDDTAEPAGEEPAGEEPAPPEVNPDENTPEVEPEAPAPEPQPEEAADEAAAPEGEGA